MTEFILLLLAGLIGGLLAGLSGIGTGIIMLAVIPYALHENNIPEAYFVSLTIANTVFATMMSSLVNVITSIRQQGFYRKETIWISITAMAIALITFETIVKSEYYSKTLFNTIIIVYLIVIVIQVFRKLKLSNVLAEKITKTKMAMTGTAAGLIAALTGLGGGTVVVPLLNLWMRVDIKKAKNISFGTIFAISLLLSINNIFLEPTSGIEGTIGLILLPVIIPLGIGVVIGSPLGVILGERLSSRTITIIFLLMTSVVIVEKIVGMLL
jgi:uncharacterized membrane protein YfcA